MEGSDRVGAGFRPAARVRAAVRVGTVIPGAGVATVPDRLALAGALPIALAVGQRLGDVALRPRFAAARQRSAQHERNCSTALPARPHATHLPAEKPSAPS